jgi:putative SOS response-associated peptidase YedK
MAEEELARRYHIPIPPQRDLPISWNIAPTEGCTGDPVQSRIEATHLGCFALGIDSVLGQRFQDPYKTINARVETVDTAPSFRQAFKKRRCLIPVDGFYEWKKVLGGKIPYSIGRASYRG